MKFRKVIKLYKRYLNRYGARRSQCDGANCQACMFYQDNTGIEIDCFEFMMQYPKKFEQMLLEWDKLISKHKLKKGNRN